MPNKNGRGALRGVSGQKTEKGAGQPNTKNREKDLKRPRAGGLRGGGYSGGGEEKKDTSPDGHGERINLQGRMSNKNISKEKKGPGEETDFGDEPVKSGQ